MVSLRHCVAATAASINPHAMLCAPNEPCRLWRNVFVFVLALALACIIPPQEVDGLLSNCRVPRVPIRRASVLKLDSRGDEGDTPKATLVGYVPDDQREDLELVLQSVGFEVGQQQEASACRYQYTKASGMLKLVSSGRHADAPNWIPVQTGMENILVKNGWSFLDPDESEPLSAFDIDAANVEGQYKPRWGLAGIDDEMNLSSLGYNVQRMTHEEVVGSTSSLSYHAQKVLLEGFTDPPHLRRTNNGFDFSAASIRDMQDAPQGVFCCAVGNTPLFTTEDLAPLVLSASDGWLTFTGTISNDHVEHIYPDKYDMDQRIEVIDAKSGCHLGHFFDDGYCINASALNYVERSSASVESSLDGPTSWRLFLRDGITSDDNAMQQSSSMKVLKGTMDSCVRLETVVLGAGCFWHVESALRRLPGVVQTECGYVGGTTLNPTYKDVCGGHTNHAEVVKVTFDPVTCDKTKLFDSWLSMHDPTNVRAHGKRAKGTGQYRSCAFVFDDRTFAVAEKCIDACSLQLDKELSSVVMMATSDQFYAAEARHQRHDERRGRENTSTLSFDEWLREYGRRRATILGSSETIEIEGDDGMARTMI